MLLNLRNRKFSLIQLIIFNMLVIALLLGLSVPKTTSLVVPSRSIAAFKHATTQLSVTVEPSKTSTSSATNLKYEAQSSEVELKYEQVYIFGKGETNKNNKNLKFLLGGKGANLADMSAIGLSVPPGFTITTEVCAAFHKLDKKLPINTWDKVTNAMKTIESEMNRKFGDNELPLLVSVRSGAAVSMPGMMDTVLNLGLNDDTVKGLSKDFGERFAKDSYRRFLNMFGCVVFNIPHHAFETVLNRHKAEAGVEEDNQLTASQLDAIINEYKEVYVAHNHKFIHDPYEQLHTAISAVFDSWNSERAVKYREAEGITGLLGTAVNVQAMVYGNMGDTSGTGVCFTRNPNTGEPVLYGEYLINAQGEDVVAGIRTPSPISSLQNTLPEAYAQLLENVRILERHYKDMQDIEFTIQEGKLFMLQTRSGKRAGAAAVKIAVDLSKEFLATPRQALLTVKPEHLNQLLHPQFAVAVESSTYKDKYIGKGLPASPGAAVGRIVFTPEGAEECFARGEKCILVRDDTSPEDVGGMWASQGVLTARGGMTSHAAVVARGWGKPCVCGCSELRLDMEAGTVTLQPPPKSGAHIKPVVLREGDVISLNGDTGEVLLGAMPLKPPSLDGSDDLKTFMGWVDSTKTIKVMANADTPNDAIESRKNGAEGIGLTRTEHMFFNDERIRVVRRMILAKDQDSKQKALNELLPYQRKDFEGILEAMDGLPVTVRLLDPPLHEFLPPLESVDDAFANEAGLTKDECIHAIERLSEVNPMLGLRGCRLGVILPELVEMQSRALIEAALYNKYMKGLNPRPEIMIPLIGSAKEFENQANLIRKSASKVFAEWNDMKDEYKALPWGPSGPSVDFKIGTMIEVPRAALTAAEIAKSGAEFFSYGTNDLTQMTFGFSRDDVGGYLPTYLRRGLLEEDPFEVIDKDGVGQLIRMSAEAARKVKIAAKLPFKAGVCGEHGGDPKSVRFFVKSGMDYVSCSPLRVPIARLAAAQAVVEEEERLSEKQERIPPRALDFDPESDKKKFVVTRTFSPMRAIRSLAERAKLLGE